MLTLAEIISDKQIDWLETLPSAAPFRRIVADDKLTLEAKAGYAMRRFELAYGADGTATRGRHSSDDDGLSFGQALVDLLYDLLCPDKKHETEREDIRQSFQTGQAAFVAYISTLVAPLLGTPVPPTSAAVAVVLSVVSKLGSGAWCASQSSQRSE